MYYNTASNVNLEGLKNLSTGTDSGALIMPEADTVRNYLNDSANGWTTQMPADPSTVRAIAVDISQRQDGSDFELEEGAELYFTVRMRARTYETVGDDTDPYNADENLRQDEVNNDYAYNNVYLGCTQVDAIGQESHAVVNYNYTRVGILPLELEVTKVWNDANNNDGVRPNAITVYLLANGDRIPDADDPTGYRSITLNEANNWRGVFQHLTQNDENGNHINYTFEEVSADSERSLEGYTQTVNRRDQHVTLTNRYTPETISFPFEKVWEGDDTEEARAYRPESITVRLYADGEFTGRTLVVRPDRAGNWAGTFTDLPRYTNPTGKSGDQQEIEYTIEEQEVYRYV